MPITVDFSNTFAPPFLRVERTIDRFGIMNLTVPQRTTTLATLHFDVIRLPSNRSFNRRFEPPREFFGYVMGMRGGRVLQTWSLDFPSQEVLLHYDPTTRYQMGNQCTLATILATQSINAAPINLSFHTALLVPYAQFRFRLWGNAAARFTWTYEPLQYPCKPTTPVGTSTLPNANTAPNPLPAGTPITASPAYDGGTDGGLTFNPGPPPPAPTSDGKTYRIAHSFSYVAASTGETVNVSFPISSSSCPTNFFGPIGQPVVKSGTAGGIAVFVPHFNAQGQPVETNITGDYLDIVGTFSNLVVTNSVC